LNPFIKSLADALLKPAADKIVAALKADEAADLAQLEAAVANGGELVPTVVNFFIAKIHSTNPFVEEAEQLLQLAEPTIEADLNAALTKADANIPALYAAGLAYFEKVDTEL
jgi:large-conductance mechanosensitive channel